MLGIDERRRCYRLAQLPNFKITHSAHVSFNENHFPCRQQRADGAENAHFDEHDHIRAPSDPLPVPASARPRRAWTPSAAALEHIANQPVEPPSDEMEEANTALALTLLPSHARSDISLASVQSIAHTTTAAADRPPVDHYDAMRRKDAAKWRASELSEYRSHVKNGTFGPPVALPPGRKAVPAAFVYKIKRDGRYKTRLVIRGYRMKEGQDYNATFAPVAHITTFRSLFALAAKHDWEIKQGDVSTAFLAPDMDAEVYITLPAGFNDNESTSPSPQDKSRTFHRLLKGAPGIPQGSHLWYNKSHRTFLNAGLQRCADDHALYRMPGHQVYLVAWVDDFFIFYSKAEEDKRKGEELQRYLQHHMDLTEWADVDDCLNCKVVRDRPNRQIQLNQTAAIDAIIRKAGLENCNPADTPVAAGFVFTKDDCPQAQNQATTGNTATWYRSILASCIYVSMWTRPDIAFAISKLSKFMQNPGPKHIMALKRLIRYLRKTKELGLTYAFSTTQDAKPGVYGYYDASHADDVDTRRSTMAYIFFFEGCAISWHSKLHSYVTTSTNHSEYCAAAKAAREAKWMEKIFTALGFNNHVQPVDLFSDSQGAIAMNYNPVHRSASKHVDLADHYAREQVERGTITISYVPTDDMIADALTKALPKQQFERLRLKYLGA
jgi:hypothetical protein